MGHRVNTHTKRGGTRPGSGRKPQDGAEAVVPVTLNIRPDQRDKLRSLGGSVFLRAAIDAAIPATDKKQPMSSLTDS